MAPTPLEDKKVALEQGPPPSEQVLPPSEQVPPPSKQDALPSEQAKSGLTGNETSTLVFFVNGRKVSVYIKTNKNICFMWILSIFIVWGLRGGWGSQIFLG